MTSKQSEAVDTLVDLYRQSRRNNPDAQTTFLAVAVLLAKSDVLDYLIAGLLKQADSLGIPPKMTLLKNTAFEIEAAMRKQNGEQR
jgi:hypothetical protein